MDIHWMAWKTGSSTMVTVAIAKFYNFRPIESLIGSLNDTSSDEVNDRPPDFNF